MKKFHRGNCFEKLLSDYFLGMPTVIIRRSILPTNTHDWFYEDFSMIEEAELFTRLAFYCKIDYVDDVLAKWRVHGSSLTWTKYEDFAKETKVMLDLFSKKIPNFNQQFESAIKTKKVWIARCEAIAFWRKGKGREARSILWNSSNKSPTLFILFWLTFFPSPWILPLLYKIRGSVGN